VNQFTQFTVIDSDIDPQCCSDSSKRSDLGGGQSRRRAIWAAGDRPLFPAPKSVSQIAKRYTQQPLITLASLKMKGKVR